ncbi:MAG: ERF family protein [Phycisphaeraceae bacterium]|nr:ERF family protein [Phycisphaeraceae bacterium]
MERSEHINELAAALCKAQATIKCALKSSENPFFKSKYADLSAVWEACRESLTKNGLSISQHTGSDGTLVTVETALLHSSGQWIASTLTMRPTKSDPQAFGSTITYARRYALAAIVGVVNEDDDGNAGSSGHAAPTRVEAARKAIEPPAEKPKATLAREIADWSGMDSKDPTFASVCARIIARASGGKFPAKVSDDQATIVLNWVRAEREKGTDFAAVYNADGVAA